MSEPDKLTRLFILAVFLVTIREYFIQADQNKDLISFLKDLKLRFGDVFKLTEEHWVRSVCFGRTAKMY